MNGKQQKKNSKANANKGSKNYRKGGNPRFENRNSERKEEDNRNHPEWLTNYPELANSAGMMSFGKPVGVPINLSTLSADLMFNPPSIMSLVFETSIGSNGTEGDAINISAKKIATFMRTMNTGSKLYDPVDIMMYLLAMDQVTMCYEWIKRAFGSLNMFSPTNRSFPRTFVQAQGFDYEDLLAHKGEMWWQLNHWASQMSSFVVPKGIRYFDRHKFLCSTMFADDTTNKSQYYVFVPGNFHRFDEKYVKGGTLYPAYNLPNQQIGTDLRFTWEQARQLMDSLIQPLLASEDIISIISGDILKTWGLDALIALEPVDANYQLMVSHDLDILWQIRNATIMGKPTFDITLDDDGHLSNQIWQDENGLIHQVNLINMPDDTAARAEIGRLFPTMAEQVITSPNSVPTSAEVMYTTRLTAQAGIHVYNDTEYMVVAHSGSEYISAILVNANPFTGLGNTYYVRCSVDPIAIEEATISSGYPAVQTDFYNLLLSTQFDFHPKVYMVYIATSVDGATVTVHNKTPFLLWQYDNYAAVPTNKLEQMHDTAIMSYFYVPTPGRV